jgi:hypothetical protein
MPYELERIIIEVISAIVCFILVKFMINPFKLTGETKYLGLPLGFLFLGLSYAFSAFSFSPYFNFIKLGWIQLFVRGFAFFFLAATYYFSRTEKNPKRLQNTILGILLIILVILILLVTVISPQFSFAAYRFWFICVHAFSMVCICFIIIHALKNHLGESDPATLAIPLGFIILFIGQYSALIWIVDASVLAFFAGLTFRLTGLIIFLYVSFKSYYDSNIGEMD